MAGSCLGGHLLFAAGDMPRVAAAFAAYAPRADPLLGLEAFGVSGAYPGQPEGGVLVTGVYNGPAAPGWAALRPLMQIPNTTIIQNTWQEVPTYYDAWYRGIGGARDPDAARRREDIQSAFFASPCPTARGRG